jgi:hypothetical protein
MTATRCRASRSLEPALSSCWKIRLWPASSRDDGDPDGRTGTRGQLNPKRASSALGFCAKRHLPTSSSPVDPAIEHTKGRSGARYSDRRRPRQQRLPERVPALVLWAGAGVSRSREVAVEIQVGEQLGGECDDLRHQAAHERRSSVSGGIPSAVVLSHSVC